MVGTLVMMDGSRHGGHTGYTGWFSTWQTHWLHWITLAMVGILVSLCYFSWDFWWVPQGFALSPLIAASRTSIGLLLCVYYVGRVSSVGAALSQGAPFCLLLSIIEFSHRLSTHLLRVRLQCLGLQNSWGHLFNFCKFKFLLLSSMSLVVDMAYLRGNASLMFSLSRVCPGILSNVLGTFVNCLSSLL